MKFENTNNIGCGKNRKHIFSKVLLMVLLAVFSFSLYGQDDDNKEFWFVAPDASNAHDDRPTFLMITTGDRPAKVTISMPAANDAFQNLFVKTDSLLPANSFWKFEFTGSEVDFIENVYTTSGTPTKKGILITSDTPVSAYYQIDGSKNYQKEIFTLKGKKALGNEFYMPFQNRYGVSSEYSVDAFRQIQIVATEHNTTVTIDPKGDLALGTSSQFVPAGTVTTRVLQKGETLLWRGRFRTTNNLTGTHITSSNPIAITLYEDCLQGNVGNIDPIGDQLVPTTNLGKNYIVVKGYSSGTSDVTDHVGVLAVENNTDVYLDSVYQTTLNAGEYWPYNLGKGVSGQQAYYVNASKPVYCMHQSAAGSEIGGALLPSLYSISGRSITFIKNNNLSISSMFLVFRETARNGFTIDGNALPLNNSQSTGFEDWMYAKVELGPITGSDPVCTVANKDGSFALGYFNGSGNTALYGYLSAFGTFSFGSDVIYHHGDSYPLYAPYALSYKWKLPDGSILPDTTISTLDAQKSGLYSLTVDQDPYTITDEVYLKLQNFNHILNTPENLLVNKSYNFSIQLNPEEHPDNYFNAKYEWNFGDDASNTISNEREVNVSFTQSGIKEIKLRIWNYANYPNFEEYQAIGDTLIKFMVEVPPTPEEMYWRSDAQDRNWNNEENWVDVEGNPLSVVPSIETRVYLPGYLEQDSYYPSLNESETDWRYYGQPEADEIIFRYGSELHHQHKLKYNKAYVNYNWGYYDGDFSTEEPQNSLENGIKLPRNTWHMLAAPLKSMASGDFSLAGHPFSWQRQFQVINNPPDGSVTVGDFSTPFSTNDIPLAGNNNAIAVKMAEYRIGDTGYRQQDYLEGLRGVIEIPYFENNGVTQYYPAHSYDALSKNSYFYYFDTKTLRIINSPMGSMKRAGEAYRFVYEDADGNLPVGGVYEMDIEVPEGAREVMVGSPLLAPIDAMAFWEKNKNTIDKDYGYKLLSEDGETWEHRDFTLDNEIPAWKAFIVTLQPEASKIFFPLEVEVDGEPTTDITPVTNSTRSSYAAGPSNDVLYVQVLKGGIRSGDAARLQYNRDRDKPDIRKMILPEGHRTPEVFFISPDGKSSNLIQQYRSGEKEVAIGVKTSDVNSRLSLEFGNIAAFSASTGASVILVDKHQNVRQDLTRNPVYSFTQQSSGLDNQYVDRYRFVLQLGGNAGPETEEDAVEGINIVYRSGILEVTSDENINTVLVYDLYGRLIFSSPSINLAQYTHPVPLQGKVYLVRVKTVSGKEKVRRIMAN